MSAAGLPTTNTAWPPAHCAARYSRIATYSAWYAGQADRLAAVYGGAAPANAAIVTPNGFRAAAHKIAGFWTQPNPEAPRRHLPIANEIATRSADLLFADPPVFTVDAPMTNGKLTEEGTRVQDRLLAILEASNADALFLQAGEISAALGSAVLRIAIDDENPAGRMPILSVVDADAAIPEYRWGQLVATTLWRTLPGRHEQDVYRHLERHAGGYVEHALYQGDAQHIGKRVPLAEHPETADLAERVDESSRILLDPNGGLTAVSIPNMLPDPLDRSSSAGRSDYTDPVIDLMDAADAVYTRMLEHIDDARSRIIIAESLLQRSGPGRGQSFDMGQRVFTKVKMPPAQDDSNRLPLEKVQFDMKVIEHLQALDSLQQRAIQAAGYSTRTDQGSDGEAMTATEVDATERRSLTTRDRKIRYWRPALARLATTLLSVDAYYYPGQGSTPLPVRVQFPEAVQPTPLNLAGLAEALQRSGGASLQTIVQTLHPDWDATAVGEEVTRIVTASQIPDPITFRSSGQGEGI